MSESNFDLTPTMPQVWYLDRAYEWHFLAPNFTTYFRMMIYHLGLPQWQLLFTPNGPTPWAKVRISIFSILEKKKFICGHFFSHKGNSGKNKYLLTRKSTFQDKNLCT